MLKFKSLVVVCLAAGSLWAAAPQTTPFDDSSRRAVQAAGEAAAARDAARAAESRASGAVDTARSADSKAAAADSKATAADTKAAAANDAAKSADTKAAAATDVAKEADSKAGVATDAAKAATKKADTAVVQAASADEVAKKASEDAAAAKKAAEEATAKANEAVKAAEAAVPEAREEARRVASSSATVLSNRSSHIVGAYFSLWGDPYPTTTGVNIGYNVYDFLRLNAGFGSDDPDVFRLNTAGVGAKLFMPGWNFSPTAGLNVSFVKNENDKRPRTVRGFSPNGAIPYANFGFDWQTGLGFNFAVGYDLPLKVGYAGSWYFNAGIFL